MFERFMADAAETLLFSPDPILYSIRNVASSHSFNGGTMIYQPLTYAPATKPDTQVGQTIHNPSAKRDGAN